MSRDQYINEVRRKSLLCIFNAQRRIIAHPLNVTTMDGYPDELHAAGCSALDYAQLGRVPTRITNKLTVFGSTRGKRPTTSKWKWAVRQESEELWAGQRPAGESGYWWPCAIKHGAVQHRLRAIDNIIKDLTPAAVSRNKREGKYIDRLNWFKRGQMVHFYGGRANGRYRKYIANWTVVSSAVQSALI